MASGGAVVNLDEAGFWKIKQSKPQQTKVQDQGRLLSSICVRRPKALGVEYNCSDRARKQAFQKKTFPFARPSQETSALTNVEKQE